MEIKHIIAQDEETRSVTLLLYGRIGDKVDGDYFAREVEYLGKEYDEIIIRVNSEGGNVLQGLSIFNAIMQSPAYTVVQVDGIAASMAGVIPFAANKITMNDFARIMLHNPYYPDKQNGLTKKEIKALENLSSVLVALVKKRCADQDVDGMLAEETWLTASDAKKIGIVDEIIDTGKYSEVENALSGIAALSEGNFTQFLIKNDNKMKVIASMFNLDVNASEAEIVNQIKALQLENVGLKTKQKELQDLADALKKEKEDARKIEIEAVADKAISAGYFDKDQRENLVALGEANFETFKTMVEKIKPATGSLTAAIDAANATDDTKGEKKDYLWYSKNDPAALAEMKADNPDEYKKLEAAYEKQYC